jgi:hypothetical protein
LQKKRVQSPHRINSDTSTNWRNDMKDATFNKVLAIIAIAGAAIIATDTRAQTSEIMMTNVGSASHPASFMHRICTYKATLSNFRVSLIAEGFCPFFINYNIITNTWSQ